MDCMEMLDIAIQNKGNKQIGYLCDIYCINVPGCGYEGGRKGDGHILDYVTFVTLPNSNNIITMFPSDKVVLREKVKENQNITQSETDISDDHEEI